MLVQKELKNGYIGEYPERWQPGANTVAYYPLTSSSTVNDLSGNSRNLTNTNISFGTYQGVDCAYCDDRYKRLVSPTISFPKTISYWTYWTGTYHSDSRYPVTWTYGNSSTYPGAAYNTNDGGDSFNVWIGGKGGYTTPISGQRYNVVIVKDGNIKVYINGNLVISDTEGAVSDYAFYFFAFSTNVSGLDIYYGALSEVIMESVGWTATEVSNYYNQTKSNYGL